MLKMLGVLLNLGLIVYLGFTAAGCLGEDQIASLGIEQNPWLLSFLAVVGLFVATKN